MSTSQVIVTLVTVVSAVVVVVAIVAWRIRRKSREPDAVPTRSVAVEGHPGVSKYGPLSNPAHRPLVPSNQEANRLTRNYRSSSDSADVGWSGDTFGDSSDPGGSDGGGD